jgi:hypothetical protein
MVEVVKAEQVGIYDVKVIRAENSNALTEWLKDSGFSFGQEDGQAFQGYVDRGWCFVTAKVRPDPATNKQQIVAEGLAAPLILIFKSDKPVYPLALTATGGKETEILIYTFSDAKLTCGGRLKLRDARQCSPLEVLGSVQTEAMGWSLSGDVAKSPPMLCKFKSRLTPEQMKQDLIFDFASDNKPYRERKIAW